MSNLNDAKEALLKRLTSGADDCVEKIATAYSILVDAGFRDEEYAHIKANGFCDHGHDDIQDDGLSH